MFLNENMRQVSSHQQRSPFFPFIFAIAEPVPKDRERKVEKTDDLRGDFPSYHFLLAGFVISGHPN
jgi:hypothetical protein